MLRRRTGGDAPSEELIPLMGNPARGAISCQPDHGGMIPNFFNRYR
jgi:hypothetical protein